MSDIDASEMFLSRQLILDTKQDIVGYELKLVPAIVAEETAERIKFRSELLICSVYSELGIRSALGRSVAFLNIDSDFIHDDILETLPADSIVLEITLNEAPSDELLKRCRDLSNRKYQLALVNYQGLNNFSSPLLSVLDIVKIDIRNYGYEALLDIISPISKLPIKILVQGIESQDDIDMCLKLGVHLYQGNYFSHPEIIEGRHLSSSQISLIQLINLANSDSETSVLENKIKHEPALTVNLLCLVNSADRGATRKISSLRDAITLLGRKRLQRWLQLLLVSPNGKKPNVKTSPLLSVAALRGRMIELLIKKLNFFDHHLKDQGFITGVMSIMPLALGLPMLEIFKYIALEQDVVDALNGHKGILGQLLDIIETFDGEEIDRCDELLVGLANRGINREMLNECLVESLRWINEIGDE